MQHILTAEHQNEEISFNDSQFLNALDIVPPENETYFTKTKVAATQTSETENSVINTQEKCALSMWGLPQEILGKYESRGLTHMFEWQARCLSNPKVLFENKNLVYSAPTSAGKTLVAEILAMKTVLERRKKVIIILPFVSVVREKMFYFQDILSSSGVRVEGFMGSHNPPGGFKMVNLAICTIEKANGIINRLLDEGDLSDIGAVIIDEMHLLGDPSRGYLLELLLTKLKYMSKRSEHDIQLIGMSATLPNLDLLAGWLGAELYLTDFRPIPLCEYCAVNGEIYSTDLKMVRHLEPVEELTEDTDNILQLCLETISDSCSVLIFCPTKNWCENLAQQISLAFYKLGRTQTKYGLCVREQFNLESITEVLEQLQRCPVGLDAVLKRTVSFAVAFHHAGLTMDERDIIEGGFRSGALRVLVATSTLSSGVNLPARRVIIRTPMFHGRPLDSLTYRQMIGRAGRMGRDSRGESFLICQKNDRKVASELMSVRLEPIESCLEGAGKLKRAILEVIASGVARSLEEVKQFASCTLLANGQTEFNDATDPIGRTVQFLIDNEFIRLQQVKDELRYVPTSLAKACLSSSLPPEDGLELFEELEKARRCFVLDTELHLLYIVTPYSVCNQWSNLDWMLFLQMWEKLPASDRRVADLVGVKESFIFNATRGKISSKNYHRLQIHRRFYTALALQDLVNEVPLSEVAVKFQCSRGMLQSLQQSASTFAGMVTAFSRQLGWNCVEILVAQFQDRLQFGIHHELLELMKLPLLNGPRARSLYNADIKSLTDLATFDACLLENILHSSVPFQSEKEREGETEHDVQQKKNLRSIWITGKKGLTACEAANMLIEDARRYLEHEMGAKINWDAPHLNDSSGETSTDHNSVVSNSGSHVSNRKTNKHRTHKMAAKKIGKKYKKLLKKGTSKSKNKKLVVKNESVYESSSDNTSLLQNTSSRLTASKNQCVEDISVLNTNKTLNGDKSAFNTTNSEDLFHTNSQNIDESNVASDNIINTSNNAVICHNKIAANIESVVSDITNILNTANKEDLLNDTTIITNKSNNSVNIKNEDKNTAQPENKENVTPNMNDMNFSANVLISGMDFSKSFNEPISSRNYLCYNSVQSDAENDEFDNNICDNKENILNTSEMSFNPNVLMSEMNFSKSFNAGTVINELCDKIVKNSVQFNNSSDHNTSILISDINFSEMLNESVEKPAQAESSGYISVFNDSFENKINCFNSHFIKTSRLNTSGDNIERSNITSADGSNENQINYDWSSFNSGNHSKSAHSTLEDNEYNITNESDSLFEDSICLDSKICCVLDVSQNDQPQEEEKDVSGIENNDNASVVEDTKQKSYVISDFNVSEEIFARNSFESGQNVSAGELEMNNSLLEKAFSSSFNCECDSPNFEVKNDESVKEENLSDVVETSQSEIVDTCGSLMSLYTSAKKCKKKERDVAHKRKSENAIESDMLCKKKKKDISIINIGADVVLFDYFRTEIEQQKEISMAVGCEFFKIVKPNIGQKVMKCLSSEKDVDKSAGLFYKNIRLSGIAAYWGHMVYYLSLKPCTCVSNEDKMELLRLIFGDSKRYVRMFDAKEQCKLLCQFGVEVNCRLKDPKVADWLLEPHEEEKSLISMVINYTPGNESITKVIEEYPRTGSVALYVNSRLTGRMRASIEAMVTWHVIDVQTETLKGATNIRLHDMFEIEMDTMKCLMRMELNGLGVNMFNVSDVTSRIQEQMNQTQALAYKLAGRKFTLSSMKDVAQVLGIYKGKKVSITKQVLEHINTPLSCSISQWRKLHYMLNKILFPIVRNVTNDRIYCCSVSRTATGRISMHEPNLQNVPRNFEVQAEKRVLISMRSCFVPSSNKFFLSADFCQLELRILAHLSRDPVLVGIMHTEEDIFKSIATKLYNIPRARIEDKLRQRVKQLCYGIIYGMGPKALSEQLQSTEMEAQDFMDLFINTYPKVRKYIDETVAKCQRNGYVETMGGRRRYLPQINDGNRAVRSRAERQAVNTAVQGSAADLAKMAMVSVEKQLHKHFKNYSSVPLVLHMHDEFLYEVCEADVDTAAKIVRDAMEGAVRLAVPLPVKVRWGRSWGDLSDLSIT